MLNADRGSDIPLVLIAYLGWKFFKKTKVVSLSAIPLDQAFERSEKSGLAQV